MQVRAKGEHNPSRKALINTHTKEIKTMTKKMTLKQFKEILNDVGYEFDYMMILRTIEHAAWSDMHEYKANGWNTSAAFEEERASAIHKHLEALGYYENI